MMNDKLGCWRFSAQIDTVNFTQVRLSLENRPNKGDLLPPNGTPQWAQGLTAQWSRSSGVDICEMPLL